ncbi:hypothetical protein GLOIN_2v1879588 [Rhizophagus irregularis DAOM 181602=DAOM 197198]|uniref:Uncharacterized protein n=1 Tax=Rhizophagus irregularis (strain DAOM 181602 / DAOM 197198 / MUCL 43194) TaxID=747089 RepID=A0A2P4PMY7_RHIID|nr:hypothetical protein GLOIN_2v1879588 [Rhizophagus irregularis DAOM 181602=DAOM 197198]POG66752.1 hypothetical protein GLOIN_2v1879588 [Rhizophagus irregularis DAOM 181602=DAOM 197198]|eukprot:XP_025173618.1 hypothetical protein GLOIN_2v1879588 [Rhizophagus irregularis DAOM 181602=DAOM 197198]
MNHKFPLKGYCRKSSPLKLLFKKSLSTLLSLYKVDSLSLSDTKKTIQKKNQPLFHSLITQILLFFFHYLILQVKLPTCCLLQAQLLLIALALVQTYHRTL